MKLPRRNLLRLAGGGAALPVMSRAAGAQAYPSRPIRPVVPFPPGGAFDTLARPWVEQVKPLLGTMFVENIGGGGSSLGAAAGAHARPAGYTILLGGTLPGQVVMGMVALTSQSLEFHRSGKLRILAVTSPERLTAAAELSDRVVFELIEKPASWCDVICAFLQHAPDVGSE